MGAKRRKRANKKKAMNAAAATTTTTTTSTTSSIRSNLNTASNSRSHHQEESKNRMLEEIPAGNLSRDEAAQILTYAWPQPTRKTTATFFSFFNCKHENMILFAQFLSDFLRKLEQPLSALDSELNPGASQSSVKKAFDASFIMFEESVDQLYHHAQSGTWRKNCPLYDMPAEDWCEFLPFIRYGDDFDDSDCREANTSILDDNNIADAALNVLERAGAKFNFKRLVKRMPEYARDIENGSLTPDEIANFLSDRYLEKLDDISGHRNVREVSLCVALQAWPWPETVDMTKPAAAVVSLKNRTPEKGRLLSDFLYDFWWKLEQDQGLGALNSELHPGRSQTSFKCAFEASFIKFEESVDQICYDGHSGSWRKWSIYYGMSAAGWIEYLTMLTYKRGSPREEALKIVRKAELIRAVFALAGENIVQGLDEVRNNCWECCAAVSNEKLKYCDRCHVSGYCSRDCQVASWKDGHKKSCALLAQGSKWVEDNLDFAEHIHSTNGKIHGIYTHPASGFQVFETLAHGQMHVLLHVGLWGPEFNGMGVDGPKLAYFYKNLAAINRKDWWIFPNPLPLDEFYKAIGEKGGPVTAFSDKLVHKFTAHVVFFLSLDLEGYAKKKILDDPNKKFVDYSAVICELAEHPESPTILTRQECGVDMPAEVITKHFVLEQPVEVDREGSRQARSTCKWAAHQLMREKALK